MAGYGGWIGSLARPILAFVEVPYRGVITARNQRFDRIGPTARIPVPVISVGNLTAGGTGKTPLVIELGRRLDAMGRSCAVVARGYGAVRGDANDEQRLIEASCPSVLYIADPDRVRGARAAVHDGADVVVLDDGFQHRRLHRDLDIVLVDATCPFGYDRLLPRGLLREPKGALRRAQVVIATRCDHASPAQVAHLLDQITRLAPDAHVLSLRHKVTSIERLDGAPIAVTLESKRVVVACAIGNPAAFVTTVQLLGGNVVARRFWEDHHRYSASDVAELFRPGRFPPHELKLTTEKDAVKLRPLLSGGSDGLAVVKIAVDMSKDDDTMLQSVLDNVVRKG